MSFYLLNYLDNSRHGKHLERTKNRSGITVRMSEVNLYEHELYFMGKRSRANKLASTCALVSIILCV